MRKNEYLKRLGAALGSLPKAEREKYLAYYSEVIDDRIEEGFSEETAVSELESVYAAAERIIAEAGFPREQKKRLGAGAIAGIVAGALLLIFAIYTLTGLPWRSPSADSGTNGGQSPGDSQGELSNSPASGTRFDLDFPADTAGFELQVILNYVEILPSEDESYHLVYYFTDNAPLELIENGKIITLRDKNLDTRNNSLSTGRVAKSPETTVLLYVPAGAKPELSIALIDCDITVMNILAKDFSVANVSGNIEIDSLECLRLDIATVSGDLSISYTVSRDLNYAATSGNVRLISFETGSASIASVSGNVHLDKTGFTSLSMGTVSGNLEGTLFGPRDDYSVSFDSVSGRNSLSGLSGGKIRIDFGSVSGSIALEIIG